MKAIRISVALVLLASAMVSCMTNESGDFAAEKFGDLSHEKAQRRAPDADMLARCGDGGMTDAMLEMVPRHPYLQNMTAHGLTVLWTTMSDQQATVDVRTVDGLVVGSFDAQVDESATLPRGRQLRTRIEGLTPGALYCYQIREGTSVVTAPAGFRTAPLPGRGERVAFIALGDSGDGGADQMAVLRQMATVPFQFIVHTGDIAYDNGTLNDFETKVFDVYGPLLQSFPMFPASGNHEYETADALPFRQVFELPTNGGPDGVERWYSYDWGDVHFVATDTERLGPEQAAWLDADLAANKLPWTIVYAHKPPFSSGEHGSEMSVRDLFQPIFDRHHVDLVLSGHDHNYERMIPQNGVNYVVTGGGGRGTRGVGVSDFTGFSEQVLHFVYVTVDGDTLSLHAIDGIGVEFDQLVIEHPGSHDEPIARPAAPSVTNAGVIP